MEQYIGLAGIPLVLALVQAFKPFVDDKRFWPIMAMILGVILNVAIACLMAGDMSTGVMLGIVTGLAAVGLYSTPKNVAGN